MRHVPQVRDGLFIAGGAWIFYMLVWYQQDGIVFPSQFVYFGFVGSNRLCQQWHNVIYTWRLFRNCLTSKECSDLAKRERLTHLEVIVPNAGRGIEAITPWIVVLWWMILSGSCVCLVQWDFHWSFARRTRPIFVIFRMRLLGTYQMHCRRYATGPRRRPKTYIFGRGYVPQEAMEYFHWSQH